MVADCFKITSEYAGLRLDVFLHSQYLDFSRAWIQKLIKKGNAHINNQIAKPKKKLKLNDEVKFIFELPPEISLEPEADLGQPVKIVFENDDFLVIDKPAGLTVHPCSSQPNHTLVNWLIWKYPEIKTIGDETTNYSLQTTNFLRPGIVHRLDKDTSGLIIAAKNQKTFNWLRHHFSHHLIEKKYLALVYGTFEKDSGKIDLNIIRSPSDPTKNTATTSKSLGKKALTYWRVLDHYPDYDLLEVAPKTGRMHQIRVHLKSMGHAIAGDNKYGPDVPLPKDLKRMFLHASALNFESPEGEKFSFCSPLPLELEQVLKNLALMI